MKKITGITKKEHSSQRKHTRVGEGQHTPGRHQWPRYTILQGRTNFNRP